MIHGEIKKSRIALLVLGYIDNILRKILFTNIAFRPVSGCVRITGCGLAGNTLGRVIDPRSFCSVNIVGATVVHSCQFFKKLLHGLDNASYARYMLENNVSAAITWNFKQS